MRISNIPGVFIVFCILVLTTITSCTMQGYLPISNSQEINIDSIRIFSAGFTKALYKTNIKIYNNELTGITIIKKTNSAMRVVAMSEMGMKYFDFEFPINQPERVRVHYIMDPLNKKLLVKMFKNDFSLIFNVPQIGNSQVLISEDDEPKVLLNYKKLNYFINKNSVVTHIDKQHTLKSNKSIITLSNYSRFMPGTIYFNHGKISLKFVEIIN